MYKKKNEILDLINRGGKHSRKTKKKSFQEECYFQNFSWKIYLLKDANIIINSK